MSSWIDLSVLSDLARDGFARTQPLLGEAELDQLSEEVARLIADLPPDQSVDRLLNWHLKADVLLELALHDAILSLAHAVLGPDLALFNTRLMVKPAQEGRAVGWHQDIAYFPLDPPEVLTVWLALDPVSLENSPLIAAPGCHRVGLLPHALRAEGAVFSEAIDPSDRALADPVALPLPRGAAVVMDGFTPHASAANISAYPRTAFIARYIATSTRLLRDRRALYGQDYPLYWIAGHPGANHYANRCIS